MRNSQHRERVSSFPRLFFWFLGPYALVMLVGAAVIFTMDIPDPLSFTWAVMRYILCCVFFMIAVAWYSSFVYVNEEGVFRGRNDFLSWRNIDTIRYSGFSHVSLFDVIALRSEDQGFVIEMMYIQDRSRLFRNIEDKLPWATLTQETKNVLQRRPLPEGV